MIIIKKIIDTFSGQVSGAERDIISFANHIEGNNHQRPEAIDPVFKVMGEFFGLPNLLIRTHEFFQKSFIYYTSRST